MRRPSRTPEPRIQRAAQWLFDAHHAGAPFDPLPPDLAPRDLGEAYAIQGAYVGLRSEKQGAVAGYKIALTTPAMRSFAGLGDSIAGEMLDGTLLRSPAKVAARDYRHLLVEFEIAFQISEDLPAIGAPYTRDTVAQAVGSVMPALEIADDRNADYAALPANGLMLVADNAWNEGAVLGPPIADWRHLDLAAVHGVARINGEVVGEGHGRDVLGHPLDALAWLANNLAARGLGLWRSDVVITGSLVASKFPQPHDRIEFDVGGIGRVELLVE